MKTLKPSWFMGKTRSLKASPNICSVIHGLDTFGPIISNLWINFQSFIVVPPCYAYPKISTLRIKVKTPMIQATPGGYCVSFCRFVDGGVLTSATFKPWHISINEVLPWGIEILVFFGNKKVSKSSNWMFNVEIHNNNYKTLHAHS